MTRAELGWTVLVAVVLMLAIGVGSLLLSQRSVRESDLFVCKGFAVMDDAYSETPPTTTAGRNLAQAMSELRHDPRCPRG